MDSKQWLKDIREINTSNGEIFSLKNGFWKVNGKMEILSKFTSHFYDSHLDLIKKTALKVLSEIDPKFNAKSSKPHSLFYGEKPKYSPTLQRGIAETLVFLGIHGKELVNCSDNNQNFIAVSIIRELFKNADWKLWASLNDILPILAEAAPREFLTSVENALRQTPCPFEEFYKQENSSGFARIGLYWALECLSWSEEHLTRSVLILADLIKHESGDNVVNSIKSIVKILLPWYPQTTGSIEKRVALMKVIQKKYPNIAWQILLELIPNHHQMSTNTSKPKFRNYIPEDWKKEVSNADYWKQVQQYAAMLVDMTRENIQYVPELIEHLRNIPESAFSDFIEIISSEKIAGLPNEHKQTIWEKLNLFIKENERFSDRSWALSSEKIKPIKEISERLLSSDYNILFKHLFSKNSHNYLLYDKNEDWSSYEEKLSEQRIEALKKIYEKGKVEAIINFACIVEKPEEVGISFASIASAKDDTELLPSLLNYEEESKKNFIGGYSWKRYLLNGISWIENLDTANWSNKQKCDFLISLPFEDEIWKKAEILLSENVGYYWKQKNAIPQQTQSNLTLAIENLLKYGRSRLAVICVYANYFNRKEFLKDLAIKALIDRISVEEPVESMESYYIVELIKVLQKDENIDENIVAKIEWGYLSLLDKYNDSGPKILEKLLSEKSDFFVEIIQMAYRSTKEDSSKKEPDEQTENLASNAWKLLDDWKRPPGKMDDGSFSSEALKKWVEEVKIKATESGHFEISMQRLGHVLFYASSDSNGLWIQQSVAELLNEDDNENIREGFSIEIFNSRGVYSPSEEEERKLANFWRERANAVEKEGFIRFATMLKDRANSYDIEADRLM